MRIRTVVFGILLTVSAMAAFAAGRKDNESHEAENPSGFSGSVGIENKKSGKYNFYIEAKDKAGNTGLAGPDNIYIDPESDLPLTTIINPRENMHVQGDLNIVGISMDDDGVGSVEVVITRGTDGSGEELLRTRADGAEFWSYFLDTTDRLTWVDGPYTITAWSVDVNGLSGISEEFKPKVRKQHQIIWNLDREKPDTKITSHEVGALVSGKNRIRGTIYDGNGVDSLGYSVDGGEHYEPVSIKYDRKNNIYNWDVDIDTRNFEDGPALVWFRARDGMGTQGSATHLLFVNNTGPEVAIVYPEPETAVNGIFTVAGFAKHPVGLKSVSWKLGKESGEFSLLPGNPWWSKEFDIRGQKTSGADLEIRAVDVSGNVTTAKRRLKVDQNADMPKISLEEPSAAAVLENGDLRIKGLASDNNGVASIIYSLDSGTPEEILCNGYFQFTVPGIPAGTHILDIWAKDVTGVTGPAVQVKGIVSPGPLPEPRIAAVTAGSGKTAVTNEFYTGMQISPDPRIVLALEVKSENPLANTSVIFNGGTPVPVNVRGGKDGFYRADFVLPQGLEGLTKIELVVTDRLSREVSWQEYAYIGSSGGGGFQWVRPNDSLGDGRFLLSGADEILVGLGGAPSSSAAIEGSGAENFIVNVDQYGRVNLAAIAEGSFGPLTLRLNGGSTVSAPFSVLADFSGPSLALLEDIEGSWVHDRIPVKFGFSDANSLKSVDFSSDLGDNWQPLLQSDEIGRLGNGAELERTLDISSVEDGAVNISVRVTDEANRSAVRMFSVLKDTGAPEGRLIVPVSGERVNGTIRMGIAVKEAGRLKSVSYRRPGSEDGEIPEIIREVYSSSSPGRDYPPSFLEVLMDATEMPLDPNMSFVFEDEAGNISELNTWSFIIDRETDIPVVRFSLPLDDEVITSDFVASGVMYDDDAVAKIYWRIDDGEEQTLEAANGFSIPLALSSLTDNGHTVTVAAEDIYGVRSEPVTRNFRVSLAEPMASVTLPTFETISRETVRISGIAFDRNDIERIQVSLDNGNTFNDAYGTIRWVYQFNSKILKDGTHVIFIKVWDKYGIPAVYSSLVNLDNTAPEIVMDTPLDGVLTTGPVPVTGRALDLNLEEVVIELRSLDGTPIPEEMMTTRLEPAQIVIEELDISNLEDGLYNIEIWAIDKAKNISRISRNVELARESRRNFVDVLYPLEGEHVQGVFNLYGYIGGVDEAKTVTLRVNGSDRVTADVSDAGYFRFSLDGEIMGPGLNELVVHSSFDGTQTVESQLRSLYYQSNGAWVTIDSLNMGDFAFERPWFSGRGGYALSDSDREILADRKAGRQEREDAEAKALDNIELSFDNGRTFFEAGRPRDKGMDWSYRLETGEMTEGLHYIVVRANMKNGETAVTRTLVQVDKTPPVVRLVSPEAGGRYNQAMDFTALAQDDVELKSLSYHLRKGDKSAYEIPGFIQGLYFEFTIPPFVRQIWNDAPTLFAGGVTYMDFGMGLSFFDDNVKVQVQYGFMTQDLYEGIGGVGPVRYGGHVLGFKLLANLYTLPFGSFAGPDWEWLSASFALGANFSLFDVGREGYTQSGTPTWLSAVLAQIEFPKVTIPKRKFLRTFSLFTEGQLWFVPTDVNAAANNIDTVVPHIILGLRLYVF